MRGRSRRLEMSRGQLTLDILAACSVSLRSFHFACPCLFFCFSSVFFLVSLFFYSLFFQECRGP